MPPNSVPNERHPVRGVQRSADPVRAGDGRGVRLLGVAQHRAHAARRALCCQLYRTYLLRYQSGMYNNVLNLD